MKAKPPEEVTLIPTEELTSTVKYFNSIKQRYGLTLLQSGDSAGLMGTLRLVLDAAAARIDQGASDCVACIRDEGRRHELATSIGNVDPGPADFDALVEQSNEMSLRVSKLEKSLKEAQDDFAVEHKEKLECMAACNFKTEEIEALEARVLSDGLTIAELKQTVKKLESDLQARHQREESLEHSNLRLEGANQAFEKIISWLARDRDKK